MNRKPFSPIYPLSNQAPVTSGRLALVLGYEGARYRGWQAQKSGVPSIQEELEKALTKVGAEKISVVCAGRTDAGVNATQQVVHCDSNALRSAYSWVMGGNHYLPKDIVLLWAGNVSQDFHARYSATARTYRYIIYNHPLRPAWARGSVTWVHQALEEQLMHQAAQHLLGKNDFSAFRGSDCQSKTPFRHIYAISVRRLGDMVILEVEANAFLYHMVRNIVGTLIDVGIKKRPPEWVGVVLASKQRSRAGITAPSNGLYLVKVHYPQQYGMPDLPLGPFFLQH